MSGINRIECRYEVIEAFVTTGEHSSPYVDYDLDTDGYSRTLAEAKAYVERIAKHWRSDQVTYWEIYDSMAHKGQPNIWRFEPKSRTLKITNRKAN